MIDFGYDEKQLERYADLLKTLAHPVRLCIVKGLIEKGTCNVSMMHTCLNMPQSTISQHLAKLKQANVVTSKRNGLEMFYSVENKQVIALVDTLFKD
ncbi:ArsR/SmtB family transcription factor [Priestia taiwanensis]|uniref:Transcriptional regulator n=1 Tax=Priestia taiwanensis TaxID=1347902 RepID=A0A917ELH5_9BACI|nr:metalloregulator ArsR/SmtB family transcription factor [Priestia taiwanensis]MBM7361877.1 ArsR family transcriptional regulator [Priestia taiwanensis]GGE57633.1 transcriptional regulator [Priestia taiwanensis]